MSPDAQPLSKLTRSTTTSPGDEVVVLRAGAADPKDRVVLVPAEKVAAASGVTVAAILNVLQAGPGVTVTLQGSKIVISSTIQAAAAPGQPAAPTAGVVDDIGDTFSFLATSAYPSFAQYKVAGLPGVTGAVVLDATNSYVQNGRIYVKVVGAVAAGGLAVYVAGSGNIPDGKPLLSNAAFTGVIVVTPPTNTTPDAPEVTFEPTARILSASHPVYGTSELEYRRNNGTVLAYAAVGVDNSAHLVNEWQYRVKAATGRTVSAWAGSPAIDAKTVANTIPVANAGTDPAITLPANQVVLQGSGTDADPGDTLTYAWRQVAGTTVSGMPSSVQQPVVTFTAAGTYQFGLIVTDNHGAASAEDFVVVTVNAAPPSPSGNYRVALEGDSLSADERPRTIGAGTTTYYAFAKPWVYWLQSKVVAAALTQYVDFANFATAGDDVTPGGMLSSQEETEVNAGYNATVAANLLFLLAAINNIHEGQSAEQAFAQVKQLHLYYNTSGPKLHRTVAFTLMATRSLSFTDTQTRGFWLEIQKFNNYVRAGWRTELNATVLIDLQSDPQLHGYDAPLNTAFYRDRLHLSEAGAARIGENFAFRALPYLAANTPKVILYDTVADSAPQQQLVAPAPDTLQESSPYISYDPAFWNLSTVPGGTALYCLTQGKPLRFKFFGTGLQLTAPTGSTQIARVSIDGTLYPDYNQSTTPFILSNLPNAEHTVTLEYVSGDYIWFDAVVLQNFVAVTPSSAVGVHEEDSGLLVDEQNSWYHESPGGHFSNGNGWTSAHAGDRIRLSLAGTGVRFATPKALGLGTARVTVNGISYTFSQNAPDLTNSDWVFTLPSGTFPAGSICYYEAVDASAIWFDKYEVLA